MAELLEELFLLSLYQMTQFVLFSMSTMAVRIQTFGDKASRERCPACHPERSEGSRSPNAEILRCAQDDRLYLQISGTDQTEAILAALAARDSRMRFVTHPVNQGYGAALVRGFAAATKELTFFMDADGQFDDASQTMRTNHWNILTCFPWKINERSVSSKRSEKNAYITALTHALEDTLQAESLLQRAECHLIETEGKHHDA